MSKIRRSLMLAITATVLTTGVVFAIPAQPGAYVEIRTYRDGVGTVHAVRYISHGCADPQPAGWGSTTFLTYTSEQSTCFSRPVHGDGR